MRTGTVGKDHWTQEDELVVISEVFFLGGGSSFCLLHILTQILKQPKTWNCQWVQVGEKSPKESQRIWKGRTLRDQSLLTLPVLLQANSSKHWLPFHTHTHFPLVAEMLSKGQSLLTLPTLYQPSPSKEADCLLTTTADPMAKLKPQLSNQNTTKGTPWEPEAAG